ncbi:MAG: exosortase/archaeosortase family protein [Armatimonadetes bacterium]|nr:exosortase/archaeosortase family protein [Akkermansiaceae bacterium]
MIFSVAASIAAIVWFFAVEQRYGADRSESVFSWLESAWNGENDYEHGILFPFVILGLIIYQIKNLRAVSGKGSNLGLIAVFIGALLYAISYRTFQPRIAAGGLPFLLWGGAYYLWGWRVAKILAFPLFFFWLAVPLPSFQQATTHLQLLATSLAHHGSSLFGVETKVVGTTILPVKGDWKPLDIATGCSGIRSLMALLMISGAWAYVAKIKMWQKVLLFMSALPLAIIGNALRVTSIFVIAEYGDAKWAAGSWHDWSGLLLFYPFSLFLLLMLHSVFEGGLPWKANNKRQLRRERVEKPGNEKIFATE